MFNKSILFINKLDLRDYSCLYVPKKNSKAVQHLLRRKGLAFSLKEM
jgi:hypothetical protein